MESNISDISFSGTLSKLTLESYAVSTKLYRDTIAKVIELDNSLPIFLDTNILLRYYSISYADREILFNFFQQHKHKICITTQVQKEFVKNRESAIDTFEKKTLENLKADFENDLIKSLVGYSSNNNKLLQDFPSTKKAIDKALKLLNDNKAELESNIKLKKNTLSTDNEQDKLVSLILEMKHINNLSDKELATIKAEFDLLKKDIDLKNIGKEKKKSQTAFPGMGDIQQKPTNPYGDFILYYEMVKYMKENSTDVIFLTFDTSKSDWISEDKQAYSHYIQITYINTKKLLYFIDAERLLENKYDKNFESISPNHEYDNPTREHLLNEFILEYMKLERLIRKILVKNPDETTNYGMPFLIEMLHKNNFIDTGMRIILFKLTKIRNRIAHTDDSLDITTEKSEIIGHIVTLRYCYDTLYNTYKTINNPPPSE